MKRVLVVDDDPDITESIELGLNRFYAVQTAADGQEALELIEGGARFDVIVLDLMMPRLSGDELAHELTARGHRIPILIASAMHDVGRRAAELPVADWIGKPFSLKQLRDKIQRLLGSGGGGSSPGSRGPSGPDDDPERSSSVRGWSGSALTGLWRWLGLRPAVA